MPPQPVSWDLGAGGDSGVPGGEGLCAGAQGWQPCPRPLTQHRHRRRGAGNSQCRQRAGSCQARLPDPRRLRGRRVAVPCSVWGQAGQIPSTALAGAAGAACPCSGGPRVLLESRGGWDAVPAASQQRTAPRLRVPSTGPSCRAQTTRIWCSACTIPHPMCWGGRGRHRHAVPELRAPAPTNGEVAPRSSRALQSGCPDACWFAQPPECPVSPHTACSQPPCTPWPAEN